MSPAAAGTWWFREEYWGQGSAEDDGQHSPGWGILAGKPCLMVTISMRPSEALWNLLQELGGPWGKGGMSVIHCTPSLTRGCRGSQVASESQFHVSRGTSTSPRKMLRPRLSRCHTDSFSMRPARSACWTEC